MMFKIINAELFNIFFSSSKIKESKIMHKNNSEIICEFTGLDYTYHVKLDNVFSLKEINQKYYIDSPLKITFLKHDYNYDGQTEICISTMNHEKKKEEIIIRCHEVLIEWNENNFNIIKIEDYLKN